MVSRAALKWRTLSSSRSRSPCDFAYRSAVDLPWYFPFKYLKLPSSGMGTCRPLLNLLSERNTARHWGHVWESSESFAPLTNFSHLVENIAMRTRSKRNVHSCLCALSTCVFCVHWGLRTFSQITGLQSWWLNVLLHPRHLFGWWSREYMHQVWR